MSEKLSRNQEALEISQAEAEKNLEKIRRSLETESSKAEKVANRENDYSSRAHELAKQSNEYTPPKERTSQPVNLQKQKNEYFAQTMQSTRKQLTQSQRLFSNVVHTKAIERTSEIIGTTVARPSALLGAFSFSAVGSVLIYIISRKIATNR